ncbi:hypothetical protein FB45DRAFT_1014955 [Roridomyces roridus]|uniref:Uncharacterized protein n=1 Tax=Roridomyces roridus TaxID=1738132 RepID=A0AAD7F5Q5_9AGAR|nr:hypothetical protein FB45DRAFT_1014955 [Roridomyces roridus]
MVKAKAKSKKCSACKVNFPRGLHLHEPACIRKHSDRLLREARRRDGARRRPDHTRGTDSVIPSIPVNTGASSSAMDVEIDTQAAPTHVETPNTSRAPTPIPAVVHGHLYIEIEYHPHSGRSPEIIPLDASTLPTDGKATPKPRHSIVPMGRRPWAPFSTRADFEWAETEYMSPAENVKKRLAGMHGNWTRGETNITIRTYEELRECLTRVQRYVLEFKKIEFNEEFEGEVRHFEFYYRDPWEWIVELVTDPSLANDIVWYPCRKYLVVDGNRQRMRDEPWTADLWWELQNELPHIDGMHHCLALLLVWLDEGRVTSHTDMYPILLRPLFLPAQIRNGSGNGGSLLVGFMVQVKDLRDPDSRKGKAERVGFARFKREIYHRVLREIFVKTLAEKGRNGECLTCGDDIRRVLFPLIPIASLDGKEADAFTATFGAMATYPCSRCLVRSDQLHDIHSGAVFEPRTEDHMRQVYKEAKQMQFKTHRENHLQNVGLHDVYNAMWDMPRIMTFDMPSEDILHHNDGGNYGKHMWPSLQAKLLQLGMKDKMVFNMHRVSRWPKLKHFDNVTSKKINDGQSWLDIEKSILPCIAHLLPRNSPWVHAIRAHLSYRMILALHCITDEQIQRKEEYQREYGRQCMKMHEQDGYNCNYPKQHSVYHSTNDILRKGAPSTYCTRVNEGHHQENREAVALGNHRNNDRHVLTLDSIKEGMARIRMTVDEYDREQAQVAQSFASFAAVAPESVETTDDSDSDSDVHWRLGAPQNLVDSRAALRTANWIEPRVRDTFHDGLHKFLLATFPEENIGFNQPLKLRPHRCLYLDYTSMEDYTSGRDILRCNPEFQSNSDQRFDFVNVNTVGDDTLSFARILYLFRCRLPSGREEDISFVRLLKKSNWKPKTFWRNCRIFSDDGETVFMLPRFFVRGAHMITAFGSPKETITYYLDDCVDQDWFLRAGN